MAGLRHLIVQLPGIGGSVLVGPDGAPAWDVSARRLAGVMIGPGRLSRGTDDGLRADRLIDSMTVIPGLVALPGYDGMVRNLRTWFGAGIKVVDYRAGRPVPPDTDVLRIPYDFRRSISDAALTVARAVAEAEGAATRGVVVVAHSMGGLVARYWIGALDGWRHCRALITLGTPHRGVPRALDVLVNGVGLGRLRHPGLTGVLRGWPSVYELLPQYPAVWIGGGAAEPVDLPGWCVRPFGDQNAGERVLRRVKVAALVHADLAAGWAAIPEDHVPKVAPYFARGHGTLNRAWLAGGRLRVSKDDPPWRGNVGWRGDGTVPTISAIPPELNDREELWRAAADKHGPMGGTPAVRDLITSLLGDRLPTRGGPTLDRPWIGFDLDDTVPAGTETAVGAAVLGDVEGAGRSATVTVSAAAPSPGQPSPVVEPMTVRDGQWQAVLAPLAPGLYEASVEVKEAYHGTSVYGGTPLVVVEPDEGWQVAGEEDETP